MPDAASTVLVTAFGDHRIAADAYRAAGAPLVVIGGREYGTGSSRDWAAKAPALLGVQAVLAESSVLRHRLHAAGVDAEGRGR